MEFGILGPLVVSDAGRPVAVTGAKQRLLLAMLLAEPGRRVSRDTLVEALWPDRAPAQAAHALDLQISRLRRAVGASRIETEDGGYRFDRAGAQLDTERFAALVREARTREPAASAELLREALGLWRGPAFGDIGLEEALLEPARALDEQRLAALEELYDAELALGAGTRIVGELETLVAEEPLRERPHEQLMLALYRCGRQAESLRVYDGLRRRLSEELGIGPGEGARRLHEAILNQDPSLEAPAGDARPGPARRRAGVPQVLAASLIVAMAALAAVALVGGGGGEDTVRSAALMDVPVEERRLAFIDLRRGELLASVSIARELGGGGSLAQGRDSDWLAGESGTLLQIDPRRHRIARSISLGFTPGAIAVGFGSVWVAALDQSLILRLDPVYGEVERRYRLPTDGGHSGESVSGMAVADESLWVAQGERRVLRLDPRTGRVLARIRVPGATSLAATADAVWVSGGDTGVLYRVDPIADAIVTRVPLEAYLCCVAVGGGYVWAMNYRVWKLASDGHVVSSVPIDGDGANLRWTGGAMWVSEGVSGQQTRIRPRDDFTRTIRTGGLALHAAVRGNVATVVTGDAPPDLLAGVRGPVARIELGPDMLQPDDPALPSPSAIPLWREQLLDATCARLATLQNAPPPLGWRVAPELAEPPTSPDARAWTFRIRPGFRFSPPSNAPVTAVSMRHTIERALSPRTGAGAAPAVLEDLVGLTAFRDGRTEHVRGLRVRGDRLTIRLRAPAPDLPLRMTSREFCAVPDGTPPGAARFISTPLSSAGPYYLAEHYGGLTALLRRNPGYPGPRPAHFAAFLYEMALQLPAGVDRVARGKADLVAGEGDVLQPRSSAARQFGATPSGDRPRWSALALPATHLLRLRTASGPLADTELRRAVLLALDRTAMAALFNDLPTAVLLPPRVAGSVAARVPRPDPARARALVGGRRVTLAFSGCRQGPSCRALALLVRASLRRVGITVRVRPSAGHADLTFREVTMSAPDPLGFLDRAGGPSAPSPRPAPALATKLASKLDKELTRNGTAFAFGTPTLGELVSARVGCRERLPLSFGDDLPTLCPRG